MAVLLYCRVTGADNGIASLFSGFLTEMLTVVIAAISFATYIQGLYFEVLLFFCDPSF